jgi:heparan-alpha-glucosaminide N-acetyltransferase
MKPAMSITERSTAQMPANHAVVTGRIASIDTFRGLTVLVMVFVDNLDFVKGLPWWTYHMPLGNNGMTYVDMVFPAFLFVMGVSIPLTVDRRAAAGDSDGRIWLHNLERSLSLVVLGLFIANAPQVDSPHTGISAVWWAILGFVGIALFWGVHHSPSPNKRLRWVMKYAGLLIVAGLFIAFRRITPGGQVAWLDFSDWEILGLLGWAYLLVSSLYLLLKKNLMALTASLVLLSALNALSTARWLGWLRRIPPYAQPFEAGLSSITMAGLIAGLIIIEGKITRNFRAKILWASGYALILAGAACLLAPLGISKLRDTPAWCLYCSAANTIVLLFLYWISDTGFAATRTRFVQVIGANALLAYMLAYVAYFNPTLFRLTADGTEGWYGVTRALLFAVLVFAITIVLTRFKFRLGL